jgi:energy-coupling factor transporter ATP-binding protein EcfA2
MEPEILILDEPTAMIDPLGKDTIVQICEALRQDRRRTIIVVEHNLEAFAPLADRVVLIGGGRIERQAPPREFFEEVDDLLARGIQPPPVAQVFQRLRREGFYRGSLPLTDSEGISAGQQLFLGPRS